MSLSEQNTLLQKLSQNLSSYGRQIVNLEKQMAEVRYHQKESEENIKCLMDEKAVERMGYLTCSDWHEALPTMTRKVKALSRRFSSGRDHEDSSFSYILPYGYRLKTRLSFGHDSIEPSVIVGTGQFDRFLPWPVVINCSLRAVKPDGEEVSIAERTGEFDRPKSEVYSVAAWELDVTRSFLEEKGLVKEDAVVFKWVLEVTSNWDRGSGEEDSTFCSLSQHDITGSLSNASRDSAMNSAIIAPAFAHSLARHDDEELVSREDRISASSGQHDTGQEDDLEDNSTDVTSTMAADFDHMPHVPPGVENEMDENAGQEMNARPEQTNDTANDLDTVESFTRFQFLRTVVLFILLSSVCCPRLLCFGASKVYNMYVADVHSSIWQGPTVKYNVNGTCTWSDQRKCLVVDQRWWHGQLPSWTENFLDAHWEFGEASGTRYCDVNRWCSEETLSGSVAKCMDAFHDFLQRHASQEHPRERTKQNAHTLMTEAVEREWEQGRDTGNMQKQQQQQQQQEEEEQTEPQKQRDPLQKQQKDGVRRSEDEGVVKKTETNNGSQSGVGALGQAEIVGDSGEKLAHTSSMKHK